MTNLRFFLDRGLGAHIVPVALRACGWVLTTMDERYGADRAERFVRALRTELTDHMLIFNQRHLHVVLAEYVRHCNGRQPHRARSLHPPQPTHPVANLSRERIKRRPVLGGLINEYERTA